MTTWVPQSCTLPTEQRPLRVAEFDALFAERLIEASRPDPLRLRLVLADWSGGEGQVRGLVARESCCCSFFAFTVTAGRDQILLDITVDAAHEAVLGALHAAATASGTRRAL